MNDEFIDVKELARRLDVHHLTVYRWVAENKIPVIQLPNSYYRFNFRDVIEKLGNDFKKT